MFDKADITRDGTISIAEYMALCEEYGVELTEEDIVAVKEIADDDGEVFLLDYEIIILTSFDIQVHKSDFIAHIKNMNMLKDFEMVDPESEFHWKKKADLAFRCVQKAPFPPFLIFLSIAAFLMPILMDMLVKKNLNG